MKSMVSPLQFLLLYVHIAHSIFLAIYLKRRHRRVNDQKKQYTSLTHSYSLCTPQKLYVFHKYFIIPYFFVLFFVCQINTRGGISQNFYEQLTLLKSRTLFLKVPQLIHKCNLHIYVNFISLSCHCIIAFFQSLFVIFFSSHMVHIDGLK